MARRIIQRAYFRKQFATAMRAEVKTATTRSSKLGAIGDLFFVHGALFEITDVFKSKLGLIREMAWDVEGMSSKAEFTEVWTSIHGEFDADSEWWFHRFKRVSEGSVLYVTDNGVEIERRGFSNG